MSTEERPCAASEIPDPENAGSDGVLHRIPVVAEHLEIGRKSFETGRVTIRTRLVEMPVERSVALERSSARVERMAADRIEDEQPQPRTEGDVTIIPIFEEVLLVRYRITGELHVHQERSVEEIQVSETLRRTEVSVERDSRTDDPPIGD